MYKFKVITYKLLFNILLRLPDFFYSFLFAIAFPVYKALHTERAYGRVVKHLDAAREYLAAQDEGCAPGLNRASGLNVSQELNCTSELNCAGPLQKVTARDMFRGIFWNALDSYRSLARFKSVERRIVFENEDIIKGAVAECAKIGMPVAGISIHQGSFELMHRVLCRYSEHVHLITDSVGDAAFRDVLAELRSDPHLTEYHPEETGRLIRELFRTKGILAMVYDQGKNTKGNSVELFGKQTTLYLRLIQKINQMGAGIVTFRTWTEMRGSPSRDSKYPEGSIVIRFETFYPPKYDETIAGKAASQAGESALVKDIARETERWIAEHPDQWSWNYHQNFVV
ncbi:MAG: lauroyl acyltransferase [Fibrobacter sp.]|uniref:LpxL/LpxP family acyltransferase n=1 Tax=Fibrobacter sp. TaxID=35828 RepID=UPI0025BBDB69|nr:lauroyl acyltransferase [Fibrobacter sp.]MBQ9225252.1 lauroyl acyltransferase [Fibrobacter sp.]